LFNHTQFNAFNNNLNYKLVSGVYTPASNFGFATGTQDPREFEFGGKFNF
jgi:hypothetical protein